MTSSSTYYTSTFSLPLINTYPCKIFTTHDTFPPTKPCEVCQKDEKFFLLTCISCGISVHNHCYAIETFQDPWQCQPCFQTSLGFALTPCECCSQSTGALRQYPNGWFHVICLTWPSHTMISEGCCGSCKQSSGKFVNCEVCWESFHPYCGFLKGLRCFDGRISCEEHLGFEENGERVEEVKEELKKKRKLEGNKAKIVKVENGDKGGKREKGVKNVKEDKVVCLNSSLAKLMKVKAKGTTEEVCLRFEDYLFLNCDVVGVGYELNKNLQKVLGVKKVLFKEVREVVMRFCG